ncbi:Cinnamyl alcohol dehydrogenase 8 [Raphanus sativus]|nr:Cinnamyl alcohol dehydrogenase 8 [Raphanus sativus]
MGKEAFGLAAKDNSGVLSPFRFSRRMIGEYLLTLSSPGMRCWWVTEVGSKVTKFKTGDKVGVGCMVGSCGSCDSCTEGLENYCPKTIQTYGFKYYDDTITYGGYSDNMVCDEGFIIRIPENLPLDAAAPLLCAGITVYSPLKYHGLDKPGGLGHVAVKFAKAMGLKVTVISTSDSKRDEAINRLGADSFVVSRDQKQIKDAMRTLDGIINTVSATHSLLPLLVC